MTIGKCSGGLKQLHNIVYIFSNAIRKQAKPTIQTPSKK